MTRQTNGNTGGRVRWIDLAKGAVIFLVIIGHTVGRNLGGSLARGAIFSFHMPFYFILSSMTYRFSADEAQLRRNALRAAKHLLTPVAVVIAVCTAWSILREPGLLTSPAYWRQRLYTVVVGSGVNQQYAGIDVPLIGIPWFFYALWIGRTAFDGLRLAFDRRQLPAVCAIASVVGVLFAGYGWLPFSLDIALACMPFFYVGALLKDYDFSVNPVRRAACWALVWALTLCLAYPKADNWTYLELACRRYPLYPICFITALAGTMVACHISALAERLGALTRPLVWIGRNSMILLVVHCVDDYWDALWITPGRQFVTAGKRIAADLAVFAAVMLVVTAWRAVRRRREARGERPEG